MRIEASAPHWVAGRLLIQAGHGFSANPSHFILSRITIFVARKWLCVSLTCFSESYFVLYALTLSLVMMVFGLENAWVNKKDLKKPLGLNPLHSTLAYTYTWIYYDPWLSTISSSSEAASSE